MTTIQPPSLRERFRQVRTRHPKAWTTGLAVSCLLLGFVAGQAFDRPPHAQQAPFHQFEGDKQRPVFPKEGRMPPQVPSGQQEVPVQEEPDTSSQTPASSTQAQNN